MANAIIVEPQGVQYQFAVEAKGQQRPLVYLNAQVDPGLVITEITGNRVARWFQTPVRPGEASQLSIWFSPATAQTQDVTFTVIARQPVEFNEEQRIRLPVYQFKWEGTSLRSSSLKVISSRPGKIIGVQTTSTLPGVFGPWNDNDVVAVFDLPATLPPGTAILLQEENAQLLPRATAAWDDTSGERRWVLTITAPAGEQLPSQLDMLGLNAQLEQNWLFEVSVPLVFRPSRSLGSALLWSMQMSKPVSKVQIKCYPLRDALGNVIPPAVSFPAWPGMMIPMAE